MNTAQLTDADVRLPRPPGVVRRAFAAHPWAVDVFIVAWYLIGCMMGSFFDVLAAAAPLDEAPFGLPAYLDWPWWPIALLRVAAVALALLLRRRYPLAGLVVVTLAMLGDHGIQSFATGIALLFMLYAVPVYRSVAAAWIGYGIAVVGAVLEVLLEQRFGNRSVDAASPGSVLATGELGAGWQELVLLSSMTAVWYLVIVMIGINLGNRRRYLQAIIDRAHQLARERDQRARLAVAEERSRIAREMHDIVAHSVSVMIALSEGAARAAAAAPDAAAEAMARSAETGRTALAEMRRMLGVLSSTDEQAALGPQPGVEDLPQLVTGFRDAGLGVELDVIGAASSDRGQELAVYRVVQEGLTNVLRYAGTGATAEVSVRRLPDRTVVEVRDYGSAPGVSTPLSGVGSGRGIAGLRERARVFGGEIAAGPTELIGGGWLLRAELPISAEARDRTAAGGGSQQPQRPSLGDGSSVPGVAAADTRRIGGQDEGGEAVGNEVRR